MRKQTKKSKKISLELLLFLIIPVLNVVSSIATPFFSGSLNPGILRGIYLSLYLIWFMIARYKVNVHTSIILIYTLYIFVLCWFSDEPSVSFYIFNKFAINSLMLVVGFYYVKNAESMLYLLRSIMISLVCIISYFVISNIFQVGRQSYQDESVFFGESGVNITKSIAIFVMSIPLYLRLEFNSKYKLIAIVILVVGLITIALGMKRSAVLATSIGFMLYTFFTPYKSRLIKALPFIIIAFVVTSPYYLPIIENRFEARQERVSMTVDQLKENESEGRVLEIIFTVNETFISLKRTLFGFNVFMTKNFLGFKRMLHVDFMNMLGGAGLIGLILFLAVYFHIIKKIREYKIKLNDSPLMREVFATSVALVGVQAFLSIGGTMQGVNLRGYILLMLGSLMGFSIYLYKLKLLQKRANQPSQPSPL